MAGLRRGPGHRRDPPDPGPGGRAPPRGPPGERNLPPAPRGRGGGARPGLLGGLLAWYTGQGTEGCLLLTPDGGTYDLPAGPEEEGRTYLAAARGWVYYLATVSREREHGAVLPLQVLQARNLATGEEVPVAEGVLCTAMVTDGAWCFLTNGATTDCYSLTTDDQGRPCGLTLVEQTI